MSDEAQLTSLGEEAWHQFRTHTGSRWLVQPSVPILYFGDLEAYQRSQRPRVITVALNPSRREFPPAQPFSRFPAAADASGPAIEYFDALNRYFCEDPYWDWFVFFEKALNGIGTSYRDGALHTDVASCLATDPTWGGLDAGAQGRLGAAGVELWLRLVDFLCPDVVLWSTASHWLRLAGLPPLRDWDIVHAIGETGAGAIRARPQVIRACAFPGAAHRRLVFFIPAAQKPLALLSHDQKSETGVLIRKWWETHG